MWTSKKKKKLISIDLTSVAAKKCPYSDDGSGNTKFAKDVGLNEFHYHLVIIGLGGHGFYPFGDIVYPYQNVLIPKRWWKGDNEIDNPDIKNFNNENGV